jgi:ATP-binding protein involved in chromosome partitioning
MAFYVCQHCGEEEPLFSADETLDKTLQQLMLGSIPFDPQLSRSNDTGTPYVDKYPETHASKAFIQVANKIQDFFGEKTQRSP